MKRLFLYRIMMLALIFSVSTGMINNGSHTTLKEVPLELLYTGVWGTIYHAEVRQCDNTPTITADGSRINPNMASNHRWIAISQEMIDDIYRASLVGSKNPRFKGKIQYGDTIWIESPYPELNGWWVAHDAKNASYTKSIDFLQTKGDGRLYANNKQWSGKFTDIKIYRAKVISPV